MKKQALLILCALVIAIGITGCGKKSKDKLADSSQSSANSEINIDTIDVGGGEDNMPTVDLETGKTISGGKSSGTASGKTTVSDNTIATEDDIPAKGETGKNNGTTSKDESKASTPSSSSSAATPGSSDSNDTPSQSDKQTMEGWGKWKY